MEHSSIFENRTLYERDFEALEGAISSLSCYSDGSYAFDQNSREAFAYLTNRVFVIQQNMFYLSSKGGLKGQFLTDYLDVFSRVETEFERVNADFIGFPEYSFGKVANPFSFGTVCGYWKNTILTFFDKR